MSETAELLPPETGTALAIIPGVGPITLESVGALTGEVVFAPGNLDRIISAIEATVRAVETDASTEKGRGEIKSLAAKVARTKTGLDQLGKDQTDVLRRQADVIHAERRVIMSRLDALRDEVRAPVTAYENREKARVAEHARAIEALLATIRIATPEPTVAEIEDRIASLAPFATRDWEEFIDRASKIYATASDALRAAHATAVRREADRRELERLRTEAAETARRQAHEAALFAIQEATGLYEADLSSGEYLVRLRWLKTLPPRDWEEFADRAAAVVAQEIEAARVAYQKALDREQQEREEREARIAAASAARARQEAEDKAERERVAAAREAERVRQEAESKAAQQLLAAEARRVGLERQKQDAERAAAHAEDMRQKAEAKARADAEARERQVEADRVAAAEKARLAEEAAVAAERRRVADEAAAAEALAKRRAADREHKARINNEACEALHKVIGFTEASAKAAVRAIANGKIPHVGISY